MHIYKGINALSDFRAKSLLKKLQAIDKNVHGVSAEYVHFVAADKALPAGDTRELEKLLTYGTPYALSLIHISEHTRPY